jgi:5-methylcytosine-specific restriction endonuclease McrA
VIIIAKQSRLRLFTKEEIQHALDISNGYTRALRYLGIGGMSSINTLKKLIEEYSLDDSKCIENGKKASRNSFNTDKIPLSKILVENSTYTNRGRLKIRLINEGYKRNVCEICGISNWNNKPIVLQLHHKNGISNDNRLDNLMLLCPNCHSQTENYCGANNLKCNNFAI